MHMAKLSISAWALHNLSLAIAYGGPVFAKVALHPAAKEIVSDKERGKLLLTAWTKFIPVDVAAHLTFTATYLYGRKVLKSRRLSHETAALVALKDILIGGALITGLANAAVGKAFAQRFPQGVPVGPNGERVPAASTCSASRCAARCRATSPSCSRRTPCFRGTPSSRTSSSA